MSFLAESPWWTTFDIVYKFFSRFAFVLSIYFAVIILHLNTNASFSICYCIQLQTPSDEPKNRKLHYYFLFDIIAAMYDFSCIEISSSKITILMNFLRKLTNFWLKTFLLNTKNAYPSPPQWHKGRSLKTPQISGCHVSCFIPGSLPLRRAYR